MLRKMLRLIFVVTLIHLSTGLQWTDSLPDQAEVKVCQGHDLHLLWNFTLMQGERVQDVRWLYQASGRGDELVALLLWEGRQLIPMPAFSGRVTLAGGSRAGLMLSHVRTLEAGNYSVHVSTDDSVNPLSRFDKTVNVQVIVPPGNQTGTIQMDHNVSVVWDSSAGQWTTQLTCRLFSSFSHPDDQIVWTTPDGHHVPSTTKDRGNFTLLLPNPPLRGNYSCALSPHSPTARCLPPSSPLKRGSTVHLGKISLVTFDLLETRQEQMLAQVRKEMEWWKRDLENQVKGELEELREENVQLRDQVQDLQKEKSQLEKRPQAAVGNSTSGDGGPLDVQSELVALRQQLEVQSRRVSFHGRLQNSIGGSFQGRMTNFMGQVHNEGDAFDPVSGIFTASVNGTYLLLASAGAVHYQYTFASSFAYLRMVKEGQVLASVYILQQSRSRTRGMGTCHVVVRLSEGERVWLESASRFTAYDNERTAFSGLLLAADL